MRVYDPAEHEFVVWREETVCRVLSVILRLVVAPSVSADFLLEELPYWSLRVELRAPVFSRLCWAALVSGV